MLGEVGAIHVITSRSFSSSSLSSSPLSKLGDGRSGGLLHRRYIDHQPEGQGVHLLHALVGQLVEKSAIIALIQLTISFPRLNLYLTNKCDIFDNNIFSKAQPGNIDPIHPSTFSSSKPDGLQGALQLRRLHRHPRHLHIRRLHYIFSCQVILRRLKDKDIDYNKGKANG